MAEMYRQLSNTVRMSTQSQVNGDSSWLNVGQIDSAKESAAAVHMSMRYRQVWQRSYNASDRLVLSCFQSIHTKSAKDARQTGIWRFNASLKLKPAPLDCSGPC